MYKRIIILGGGGSGKSTLASRISEYTDYPVYHLDAIFHDKNWKKEDKNKLEDLCKEFLLKDVGIVDGNYTGVLKNRIDWADLIIFIDVSTFAHVYRYFRRIIRHRLGIEKRIGIPDGAKANFNLGLFKWIYNWNKIQKKKVFSLLESAKDKKIVIIKEPRKLDIKSLLE